jgi:hypothetical protein
MFRKMVVTLEKWVDLDGESVVGNVAKMEENIDKGLKFDIKSFLFDVFDSIMKNKFRFKMIKDTIFTKVIYVKLYFFKGSPNYVTLISCPSIF